MAYESSRGRWKGSHWHEHSCAKTHWCKCIIYIMRCRFESAAVKNQFKRELRGGGWRSFIICGALGTCVLPHVGQVSRCIHRHDTVTNKKLYVTCKSTSSVRTTVTWSDRVCIFSWPCLHPFRDRVCEHRHKNVATVGIFFVLFPSPFWGAKKEGEKKEESSWSSAVLSLSLYSASTQL